MYKQKKSSLVLDDSKANDSKPLFDEKISIFKKVQNFELTEIQEIEDSKEIIISDSLNEYQEQFNFRCDAIIEEWVSWKIVQLNLAAIHDNEENKMIIEEKFQVSEDDSPMTKKMKTAIK